MVVADDLHAESSGAKLPGNRVIPSECFSPAVCMSRRDPCRIRLVVILAIPLTGDGISIRAKRTGHINGKCTEISTFGETMVINRV